MVDVCDRKAVAKIQVRLAENYRNRIAISGFKPVMLTYQTFFYSNLANRYVDKTPIS